MKRTTLVLLTLLVTTLVLSAAGPSIGFVAASGEFRLNQAPTRANGTLFDGSTIETTSVRSDVSLTSGAHLAVAPNSKARIYKDHAVLETGAAAATGFPLIADKLAITGSSANVAVDSASRIRVEALTSPVEGQKEANVRIARVNPGTALSFDNQGGASGPIKVTGMVTKENDIYFITDRTTNVKYQLRGTCFDKDVNKVGTINGSLVPDATPVGGATAVVAVSSDKKGCAVFVPWGAGAGAAAAGAAAGVGLSHAAIAGIVVAVVAGGVVGGAAVAGVFSSSPN